MKKYNRIIHFIAHPYFQILSFLAITFVGEKLFLPFFIFLLGSFSISPETNYLTTISGIIGVLGILICYVSTYRPFKMVNNLGVTAMLISLSCSVWLNPSHVFIESIKHPITYCTIGIFLISVVLGLFTNIRVFILGQKEAMVLGHSEVVTNGLNPSVQSGILTIITSPITLLIFYLLIIIPDQDLPLPFIVLLIIGFFKYDIYAIVGLFGLISCIVSRYYLTRFLYIVAVIMLNIPIIYILFGSAPSDNVIQPANPFFYVTVCLFMITSLIGLVYRIMPSLFVKFQK